jgi:hypothetical protein
MFITILYLLFKRGNYRIRITIIDNHRTRTILDNNRIRITIIDNSVINKSLLKGWANNTIMIIMISFYYNNFQIKITIIFQERQK